MSAGRNDPCPCGSGRKSKHCCGAAARLAEGDPKSAHQIARAAAGSESAWEADAVPLLIRIDESNAQRPVVLLVTAGDVVLHHDLRGSLGGEIEDVAAAIERAVVASAREFGVFPERVRVRHADVGGALAPRLAARQVDVEAGTLVHLPSAARSLQEALGGSGLWPPVSRCESWLGWQLPGPTVARVFEAAARYYRAAPWRAASNFQAPRAVLPSGRAWTCALLGDGGEEFGLALYSDAGDLFEGVAMQEEGEVFDRVRGRVVSLVFDRARDVGPRAAREASAGRWEVAGPNAYPALMTVNTPGGGISRTDVDDLVTLLGAVPDFVTAHRSALIREQRNGEPLRVEWTHAETGIVFRYAGEGLAVAERLAEEPSDGELEQVNERFQELMGEYNAAPQGELGGLSPEQVHALLASDWSESDRTIRLRNDLAADDLAGAGVLADVRSLLALAAERGGLGATDAGNLKLTVVAQLLERLDLDGFLADAGGALGKRVTERDVWPLHELRVVCGLAGLLRRRSGAFHATPLARELLDPARSGELFALLFHTWFRRFDIRYGGWGEWPELQHQIAFTLYRLPDAAADWRLARELLPGVVLPYALSRAGHDDIVNVAAIELGVHVLDPLAGFGLLERAAGESRGGGRYDHVYRATTLARSFIQFGL